MLLARFDLLCVGFEKPALKFEQGLQVLQYLSGQIRFLENTATDRKANQSIRAERLVFAV